MKYKKGDKVKVIKRGGLSTELSKSRIGMTCFFIKYSSDHIFSVCISPHKSLHPLWAMKEDEIEPYNKPDEQLLFSFMTED